MFEILLIYFWIITFLSRISQIYIHPQTTIVSMYKYIYSDHLAHYLLVEVRREQCPIIPRGQLAYDPMSAMVKVVIITNLEQKQKSA